MLLKLSPIVSIVVFHIRGALPNANDCICFNALLR